MASPSTLFVHSGALDPGTKAVPCPPPPPLAAYTVFPSCPTKREKVGRPPTGCQGVSAPVVPSRATSPPFFFPFGSVASVVPKWRKFPPARRVEPSAVIAMSWTSGGSGLAGLGVPPWPS